MEPFELRVNVPCIQSITPVIQFGDEPAGSVLEEDMEIGNLWSAPLPFIRYREVSKNPDPGAFSKL